MYKKALIRMPLDVAKWLKSQGKANSSNMTAEVVRSVRERMDRVVCVDDENAENVKAKL